MAHLKDPDESVDTPKRRRSSRSRTKSPEPAIGKTQEPPSLSAVVEEPEDSEENGGNQTVAQESAQETHPDSQYEKIIDEMDVDDGTGQDDVNEDELLAEPEESSAIQPEKPADLPTEQHIPAKIESQPEEKPETGAEPEENRGVKRRSDSPSKGNTPKKRQRLPPPNIEDFVNDEDEPELDENSVQLSWCKLCIFLHGFEKLKLPSSFS